MFAHDWKIILNSFPAPVALLDDDLTVKHANSSLLSWLKLHSQDDLVGKRIGEIFSCVSSIGNGCGKSNECEHCVAQKLLFDTKVTNMPAQGKELLLSKRNNRTYTYDLKISTSPLSSDAIMVTMEDISDKKRKEAMERTFLHDMRNSVSSVCGLAEMINMTDDIKEITGYADEIQDAAYGVVDEMRSYVEIQHAESGNLYVDQREILLKKLIESSLKVRYNCPSHIQKDIILDTVSAATVFTDPALIRRVVNNMIINAFEAKETTRVEIGGAVDEACFHVWVWNDAYIPEEIQAHIFQRYFSTKGEGRGIGTYGMKLLIEDTLGGDVTCSSDPEHGTIFSARVPSRIRNLSSVDVRQAS